jgi:predicted phosphoadenosine phosphosulfate sulfurtransferase
MKRLTVSFSGGEDTAVIVEFKRFAALDNAGFQGFYGRELHA